jgi:hypothetical protein
VLFTLQIKSILALHLMSAGVVLEVADAVVTAIEWATLLPDLDSAADASELRALATQWCALAGATGQEGLSALQLDLWFFLRRAEELAERAATVRRTGPAPAARMPLAALEAWLLSPDSIPEGKSLQPSASSALAPRPLMNSVETLNMLRTRVAFRVCEPASATDTDRSLPLQARSRRLLLELQAAYGSGNVLTIPVSSTDMTVFVGAFASLPRDAVRGGTDEERIGKQKKGKKERKKEEKERKKRKEKKLKEKKEAGSSSLTCPKICFRFLFLGAGLRVRVQVDDSPAVDASGVLKALVTKFCEQLAQQGPFAKCEKGHVYFQTYASMAPAEVRAWLRCFGRVMGLAIARPDIQLPVSLPLAV